MGRIVTFVPHVVEGETKRGTGEKDDITNRNKYQQTFKGMLFDEPHFTFLLFKIEDLTLVKNVGRQSLATKFSSHFLVLKGEY